MPQLQAPSRCTCRGRDTLHGCLTDAKALLRSNFLTLQKGTAAGSSEMRRLWYHLGFHAFVLGTTSRSFAALVDAPSFFPRAICLLGYSPAVRPASILCRPSHDLDKMARDAPKTVYSCSFHARSTTVKPTNMENIAAAAGDPAHAIDRL